MKNKRHRHLYFPLSIVIFSLVFICDTRGIDATFLKDVNVLFQIVISMDIISSIAINPCAFGVTQQDQGVVVKRISSPKVDYSTWGEFADLLFSVQENYCLCLVVSLRMDVEAHAASPLPRATNSLQIKLSHLQEQGPRIIMELTKREGAWWCAMVAHFVCSRVLRAASIYQHIREELRAEEPDDSARDEALASRRMLSLIEVMKEEVRHTFSGAMPFSIYTLCSGFVSTLLVDNFTFYDNGELTAFTHSQFEDILLTLCMGLHRRLGLKSPWLSMHDELLQSVCSRLRASQLKQHIVCHTYEERL
jgi:hypothetical protein